MWGAQDYAPTLRHACAAPSRTIHPEVPGSAPKLERIKDQGSFSLKRIKEKFDSPRGPGIRSETGHVLSESNCAKSTGEPSGLAIVIVSRDESFPD